jgi:hypothetical protein
VLALATRGANAERQAGQVGFSDVVAVEASTRIVASGPEAAAAAIGGMWEVVSVRRSCMVESESSAEVIQEDHTWGVNGLIAWTSWLFPLPIYVAFELTGLFTGNSNESYGIEIMAVDAVFICAILFCIFLSLSALLRVADGFWVIRKVVRNGDSLTVFRYFYPLLEFNVSDIQSVEVFYQNKIRRHMSLLYFGKRARTECNYCVQLKNGGQLWMNGEMFDPDVLFAR